MYQFLPWETPYGLGSYANFSNDFYGTSALVIKLTSFFLLQMVSPQTSWTRMQLHCTSILPGWTAINSIFPETYHNSSNHRFQLKMLTYIFLLMWLMLYKSNQLPTTNSATSIQFQFYYSCNLTPAFTWSKLASFAVEFGNPASMLLWSVIKQFIKHLFYIQMYCCLVSLKHATKLRSL